MEFYFFIALLVGAAIVDNFCEFKVLPYLKGLWRRVTKGVRRHD